MNPFPIHAYTDNYIWALVDTHSGIFDCIDPGDGEPVLSFAQNHQLKLRSILITHHHQDHIGGVGQLIKCFPSCAVYGPKDSRIPFITNPVKKNDLIQIGENQFKVLFNPGHTSTHISYYEINKGWLFCGDTLFSGGCGRVFDGTAEELHQSLLLFKNLPPATKVFCAHEYTLENLRFAQTVEPDNQSIRDYTAKLEKQPEQCTLPSTIAIEQEINPFFRTDKPSVIEFSKYHGASTSDSLDVFKTLRMTKNNFK